MSKHANGEISRKDFLKASGLLAGGAVTFGALGTLGGCGAKETGSAAAAWLPSEWTYEADVVVAGFGGAGASAAIEAADAGAKVLILEKMPEGQEGGASGINGGIITIADWHGRNATVEGVNISALGTASEAVLNSYVESVSTMVDWLTGVGVPVNDSVLPGMEIIDGPVGCSGYVFFKGLKEAVVGRGIEVMYEMPVWGLIQNPETMEVLGVKAGPQDNPVYVKANKGVLLSTGGFEANPDLIAGFYNPGVFMPTVGSPANTGEGLKMAMKAGVQIHNVALCLEYCEMSMRVPSEELGTAICIGPGIGGVAPFASYIYVNRQGERYTSETETLMHQKSPINALRFNGDMFQAASDTGYPNLPAFMIFDDKTMKAGPIGRKHGPGGWGWNSGDPELHHVYEWSDDNQAELASGWIIQADTLEELAGQLEAEDMWGKRVGLDASGLVKTVADYNISCAAGADGEFNRLASTLSALDTPPFYAVEICPTTIYTIGGPKHDENAQAVDFEENPVPRLYMAGNVADVGVYRVLGLAGVVTWGRIAGRNMAALEAWA